jgi:hypothetical protein
MPTLELSKMYPKSKFNQQTILTDKSDISIAISIATKHIDPKVAH